MATGNARRRDGGAVTPSATSPRQNSGEVERIAAGYGVPPGVNPYDQQRVTAAWQQQGMSPEAIQIRWEKLQKDVGIPHSFFFDTLAPWLIPMMAGGVGGLGAAGVLGNAAGGAAGGAGASAAAGSNFAPASTSSILSATPSVSGASLFGPGAGAAAGSGVPALSYANAARGAGTQSFGGQAFGAGSTGARAATGAAAGGSAAGGGSMGMGQLLALMGAQSGLNMLGGWLGGGEDAENMGSFAGNPATDPRIFAANLIEALMGTSRSMADRASQPVKLRQLGGPLGNTGPERNAPVSGLNLKSLFPTADAIAAQSQEQGAVRRNPALGGKQSTDELNFGTPGRPVTRRRRS